MWLCFSPSFLRGQAGPDEYLAIHAGASAGAASLGLSKLDVGTGVFGPVGFASAAFSVTRDGTRIAYKLGTEIRVANLDGSNSTVVASGILSGDEAATLKWSPSEDRLAYLRRDASGSLAMLHILPLSGGPPVTFEHPELNNLDRMQGFDWSPDGTEIVYITSFNEYLPNPYPRPTTWVGSRVEIRVLNLAAMTSRLIRRNVHRLDDNGPHHATYTVEIFDWPRWSPDGTKICLERDVRQRVQQVVSGGANPDYPNLPVNTYGISMLDPRPGGDPVMDDVVVWRKGVSTVTTLGLTSPVWSPDGSRLAYRLSKNPLSAAADAPVDGVYVVSSSLRAPVIPEPGATTNPGDLLAPYTAYPNGAARLVNWINTKPVAVSIRTPRRSFQMTDDFTATVTVGLTKQEPWRVRFPGNVLVAQRPGVLEVEPQTAEPFDLVPTPEGRIRSFTVKVKAIDGGLSRLISDIEATAGPETHTISGSARISVSPLVVTVQTKPLVGGKPVLNMELDPDGTVRTTSGSVIVPKVEVKVENRSARAIQTHIQGLDPRKRDRSTALGRISVTAAFPQEFAAIPGRGSVARDFPLQINADGRFDFVALVSGTIAGSPEEGFETSKRGAPVAIGEPYPMKIEFKPAGEVLSQMRPLGGGAFILPPGDSAGVLGIVSNLTTNATLKFKGIEATTFGNARGGLLTTTAGGQTCPIAVEQEVDAGSQAVLTGQILTQAVGPPSGTVLWELPEEPSLKDDATGEETVLSADDILVEGEAVGWGGDDLAMHLIQDNSQPVRKPLSFWLKAAYFEEGAMIGIGQWFYEGVDAIGAIGRVAGDPSGLADALGEGSRAFWEAAELAATTWYEMTPEEREAYTLEVAREVQRRALLQATTGMPFDRNDFGQVLSFTQNAIYPLFNGMEQAYASNDPIRIAELWGRVTGNIAMEAATCFMPTPKFTRYTTGADAARLADNQIEAGLMTSQEAFLLSVDSGPVDEVIVQKAWGQGGEELSNFQRVFRTFGVRGYMRERAPEATRLIEELAEAIWKPEAMKPKGINDTDLLLLGNPPPTVRGKPPGNAPLPLKAITGIFYPETDSILRARFSHEPPEIVEAIIERAKFRREEYLKFRPKFQQWKKPLNQSGGIPVKFNYSDNAAVPPEGSVAAANRAFDYDTVDAPNAVELLIPRMANSSGELRLITGDVDWIHFTFENGLPLDKHTASLLYAVLQRYGLQHPETISWIRNGQSVFAGKISQIGEYLKGQKALLEVGGNSLRAVHVNPNLTRFGRTGREHLIFFDGGTKEIKAAIKQADLDNAFAFLMQGIPPRPVLLPFLWTQRWTGPDDPDTSVGGNDWAFSGEDDALLIRQLEDGALEQFTDGAWIPWSIPNSAPRDAGTLQLAPLTVTEATVSAGATTLPLSAINVDWAELLAGHLDHWFSVDDLILIAPGTAQEEVRRVSALTPFTVHAPLRFAHAAGTTVAVLPGALALQDGDGDGLNTLAEMNLGTHPHLRDSDGDGASDGEEVQLGTGPLDPASHFRILSFSIAPNASALTVTWSSVPGKRYVVETAAESAPWSASAPINAAAASQTSAVLPITGPARRFLCRVRLTN